MKIQESLEKQTVTGIGWSAVERFATQGISFLIQLVLARLLMPSDYGIIAMLAIFLQIAQVFIDSGFANALIKKQNCTEKDYSTVFYYNLAISITIYVLFFSFSPIVARFYDLPEITNVMRLVSLVVILNALCIVQRTKLIKAIDFKSQAKVSLCSMLLSGWLGLYLAYQGVGVWALCWQTIANVFFQNIFLFSIVKWFPSLIFSRKSFVEMFGFGSKILGASIISVIYSNLYTIVIGKMFQAVELGNYSRAEQFAKFPSSNIGNIIARVMFPVLSRIQDEDEKLRIVYRKIIRCSSFLIFPLMIGLAAIATPLVIVVLTEKWLGIVTLLQIACLSYMWDHLSLLNLNILYVKGRSDLVFKLEVIKKSIAVLVLVVTIPHGLIVMCWGLVAYSLIALYLNAYYTKKLLALSFLKQLNDVTPYLMASLTMGGCVLLFLNMVDNVYIQLIAGVFIGIITYSFISLIFFKFILTEVKSLIRRV